MNVYAPIVREQAMGRENTENGKLDLRAVSELFLPLRCNIHRYIADTLRSNHGQRASSR